MKKIKKPVLMSKEILDSAFSKAKNMPFDYRTKSKLEFICKKNMKKIDIVYDVIASKLSLILDEFPKINELEGFERGFVEILLDIDKLKKELYRIKFSKELNKKLYLSCRHKLRHAKAIDAVDSARSTYYGRISSVIEKLSATLIYIEKSRRTLNTIPLAKNRYNAVVCGFPNTGKSTLMANLSGATPKIMPYAFTTQKLLFSLVDDKVQLIDTPGVLDNIDSKNASIQQAKLAAATLADIIVFIFDFTDDCHYSIDNQITLKKAIEKINSNMIFCVNKIDCIDLTDEKKSEIESVIKTEPFYISAKKNINTDELKKVLLKNANEFYNR